MNELVDIVIYLPFGSGKANSYVAPLFSCIVLVIQYLTFLCYFCTCLSWAGDCLVFGYLTAQLLLPFVL
jgi:hypothetical protein